MDSTLGIDPDLLRVIVVMTLITLPLKAVAMWHAARAEQKGWYAALLIFNSLGLLELTYLFYFSTTKSTKKEVD